MTERRGCTLELTIPVVLATLLVAIYKPEWFVVCIGAYLLIGLATIASMNYVWRKAWRSSRSTTNKGD
jgi:hypothetical protein